MPSQVTESKPVLESIHVFTLVEAWTEYTRVWSTTVYQREVMMFCSETLIKLTARKIIDKIRVTSVTTR